MIKDLLKMGMATSLGWRATAPLRRPGVIALMYHRINADHDFFPGMPLSVFRTQMEWISRYCSPIPPASVLEAAREPDRVHPPVIVTFDDGYRDYYDHAYPILRDLGIPAIVFLSTDCMDGGKVIWTEALHWAATTTRKSSAILPWRTERKLTLTTAAERLQFVSECKAHLKTIPDGERRHWVSTLLDDLAVPDPEERLGRQVLSWDEVRACRAGTTFGGHTHTHPILSQLQPESMENEIRICRDRIATELGEAPNCFAYPNGRASDFNQLTKDLLRRHGFVTAFSTIEGVNRSNTDPFALRRTPAYGQSSGDIAALIGRAGHG